jgi:hypothetical protein
MDAFGGSGNREERIILAQVPGFFEATARAAVKTISAANDQRIPKRAGFTGME